MLKSIFIAFSIQFLLAPSITYADFTTKEGKILRRFTPSSTHLIKRSDVEALGYNWAQTYNALVYTTGRINNGSHNYSIAPGEMPASQQVSYDNKKDEVYFGPTGTLYAITQQLHYRIRDAFGNTTGFDVREGDIILNNTRGFFEVTGSTAQYLTPNAKPNLEDTLIHELGHSMGLQHNSTRRHSMGGPGCSLYANGNSSWAYLGQAMNSELQTLYGVWNGGSGDFAVSSYNIDGQLPYAKCGFDAVDGGLSSSITNLTMYRGAIRDGAAGVRAWALYVSPGDTIRVKFTIEANKAFSNIPATIYYSTNNVISTTDTPVWNGTITPSTGSVPLVATVDVFIPYATGYRGYAAIGIILDPSNQVSQWATANDIAYIPIYMVNGY